MSLTNIILLERVDGLGVMGDTVSVKPGYARNYLLPQKKALRATKSNLAYFEAQRKVLEEENEKRKSEASAKAKKLEGLDVVMVRQASESGQLYGSVTARDIATSINDLSGERIEKGMVDLNQSIKTIGLFSVIIRLHAEVKIEITINIARNTEEAKTQKSTGRALIAEEYLSNQEKAKIAASKQQTNEQEVANESKEAETTSSENNESNQEK